MSIELIQQYHHHITLLLEIKHCYKSMKNNLLDEYSNYDPVKRFNSLHRRVFLDTNVLQYLQDFGEYIFESYNEYSNDECFC